MRFETIHSNELGEVVNPTSATGIRIVSDDGSVTELRIIDNQLEIRRAHNGCQQLDLFTSH